MNNGYLVVASRKKSFYRLAINCLESLKDYYPDARCCLVTEEKFLDGREDIADDLIFCDNHYRAKLWGMANSPYDITMYIDADSEIEHEDIAIVFDEIVPNIVLTISSTNLDCCQEFISSTFCQYSATSNKP